MNLHLRFLVLLWCCLLGGTASAQTFWSDNFEDTGSPSTGSRTTSVSEFKCTSGFFKRTDGTDKTWTGFGGGTGDFTGYTNSKYFAAMDVDRGPACGAQNAISAAQSITWSNIDISGKTGLNFKGRFGANTGAVFQGTYFNNSTNNFAMDYIVVEYRLNGTGSWNKVLGIYPNDATANGGPMAVDTNNDQVGDGTVLGNAMQELSADITATGTSLDLRVSLFVNNGSPGAVAFDDFRLSSAACTAPSIKGNPANRSVCVGGNTTFSATATGATGYKWQVDVNASGNYSDISNGGVYSTTTTGTLTITGVTAAMNGYRYRAVAMNGSATCATNSGYGTLSVSNMTATTAKTDVLCYGTATGSASVTAVTGNIGSVSYSWSPSGGTGASATGLAAGDYTVTITDLAGCSITRDFTIGQPSAALGGSTAKTDVSCFGGSNGTATVVATGGMTPYSYSWTGGGGSAATATGLSAGSYTVTVTDNKGCTITRSVTVLQPGAALSLATGGGKTDVSCFGGDNGTATVAPVGGTAPYSYSWSPSGGTGATASGLSIGTYTVTVTDFNGCQATRSFTIGQPSAALGGSISKTDVSCNGDGNGTATVVATGGTTPYTYSWTGGGGSAATATGLSAGSYTVTVTDFNGCQITRSVTVGQPSAALSLATGGGKTDVSCFGGGNGTATVAPVGGTGPYTYSWSPSGGTGATASGLSIGTYTVTVTDFNGCQATRSFAIGQPSAALGGTISKTDVSCNGGGNGTATVVATGGTTPYTYSWTGGGGSAATATGLSAGSYTVTVTDNKGCTITRSVTVGQPSAALSLAAGGGKTDVSCFGGGNGTATVAPVGGTGPYSYSWSPSGGTGATASGLSIGTYTVTVTDFNGCQATRSFTIGQPGVLDGSISKTDVSCNGGSNGTATVVVSGGTSGYSYLWSPSGGTAATATGLTAGTYTVTVTDNNGCTIDRSVTVGQPSAALSLLNWSKTDVLCRGGSNGSATVVPTGGTAPYTYAWTGGGGTAATASGLSAGTYTVTVTDNWGCQATRSFTINQPGSTVSLAYTGSTSISKGTAFSYGFSAAGGTPGYSYSATGTLPTGLALSGTGVLSGTPTAEGTFNFSVTASDANGCTVSVPVGITVLATLPVGMVDFSAKLVSAGVSLHWQTSYEDNATRFELWHKAEDGDFSRLTTLPATGNRGEGKRYGYLHGRPAFGNNYYQLFQFDRDGTRADLGLKVVQFNGAANDEVLLYPNPAAHVVTVKFSAGTYVKLEVVDMLGKVLLGQRIAVGDTEGSMNIDGLPRGSYTVILYTADRRSVHKLIKL